MFVTKNKNKDENIKLCLDINVRYTEINNFLFMSIQCFNFFNSFFH